MSENHILKTKKKNIFYLTLNREQKRNALTFEMLQEICETIEGLITDPDIRVVIITGAGEKAFCAGADLKERATLSPMAVKEFIFTIRNLFTAIEQLNKPVIAAVNGIALGGGTELALACDIRIAADNATMGLTETKLAIIPGAGGTQRLPRLVGRGKANELIFTGRRIGAAEALNMGMVNRICPKNALLTECYEMAAMICETGPIAIEQAKYAINYGMETDNTDPLSYFGINVGVVWLY